VVHVCYPNYTGNRGTRIVVQLWYWAKAKPYVLGTWLTWQRPCFASTSTDPEFKSHYHQKQLHLCIGYHLDEEIRWKSVPVSSPPVSRNTGDNYKRKCLLCFTVWKVQDHELASLLWACHEALWQDGLAELSGHLTATEKEERTRVPSHLGAWPPWPKSPPVKGSSTSSTDTLGIKLWHMGLCDKL
jgi:hypothetical protein